MKYDIFISYRRKGGFETAKHLYDLLSRDGYSVSFDIDTLRNGDFDTALLSRIEECTDFILILNQGAFDRTLDPSFNPVNDWMRNELSHALKHNKNIIPVMLEGFTAFPDNLPADIAKVVRKNGPKYDSYYFDDFYRRMKQQFFETPEPDLTANGTASKACSTIKFVSNMEFELFIDGKYYEKVAADTLYQVSLPVGEYYCEFISPAEGNIDKVVKNIKLENLDITVEIDLKTVCDNRKREEEEALKLIRKKYGYNGKFSCGLCMVCINGLYGFVNAKMEEVVPFIYDYVDDFEPMTNTAKVQRFYKLGTIDQKGNCVIPMEYAHLDFHFTQYDSFCYIGAQKGQFAGIIDSKGNVIVPFEYGRVGEICDNKCVVGNDDYVGLYDIIEQKLIFPLKYKIILTEPGYAILYETEDKGELKFYDNSVTINFEYDDIRPFFEDLAAIKIKGAWGYINRKGNIVIKPQYEDCSIFSCGVAAVCKGGKWGYIDHIGLQRVDFKYDQAHPMKGGCGVVKRHDEIGLIDKSGKILYPFTVGLKIFRDLYSYEPEKINKICFFTPNNACRLMDERGNIHNITEFKNDGDMLMDVIYEGKRFIFMIAHSDVDWGAANYETSFFYSDGYEDYDERSENPEEIKVPQIGDVYVLGGYEGIVVEYDETTGHGKAVSKLRVLAQWEDSSVGGILKIMQSRVSATMHKDGRENCKQIYQVKGWERKYPCVSLCSKMGNGWYLPALEEFNRNFGSKEVQQHYPRIKGDDHLSYTKIYWTSNSPQYDDSMAWSYATYDQGITQYKQCELYVVAMRHFHISELSGQ